ncbi:family 43 glycoside hydrolase [Microthyrium microscopicum]|uniref:Family 43 glycoside hydrolase n=1 Tax=Microthyrium microscopicum TaxID=703497 RepID=A0A6A6U2J5_9PEZI|nr:family 43 glycoside hydrolase [Microthyrium microscopicum]
MHIPFALLLIGAKLASSIPSVAASDIAPSYVGYLISTFSDVEPTVKFYLSNGNDPGSYKFLNRRKAALISTVGTRAVRDVFLAVNGDRTMWYMIATDLDVKAPGFSWDKATRKGSRSIVVFSSPNLVDWSAPSLVTVEDSTAGMVWAPSAVWDEKTSQFHVFWASKHYQASDKDHTGKANQDRIRYASTADFKTFTAPTDYIAYPGTPVIDQEFQYLGTPGHFARFFKNETQSQVYQEMSTTGLFGQWKSLGPVTPQKSLEGPACFADIKNPGVYHLLLDDYKQYIPFTTMDISSGKWQKSNFPLFPSGLKHGSVTPVTQAEYEAVERRFPA